MGLSKDVSSSAPSSRQDRGKDIKRYKGEQVVNGDTEIITSNIAGQYYDQHKPDSFMKHKQELAVLCTSYILQCVINVIM